MAQPQLFVTITSPPGALPFVDRTFELGGNISWMVPTNYSLTGKSVTVQFGSGGTTVAAAFVGASLNWRCTGTVSPATSWGAMVTLTVSAQATFRFFHTSGEQDIDVLNVQTTFRVRLMPAIAPTVTLTDFASPIIAAQLPLPFTFTGSATSPQAPIQRVQYAVEGGQFASAVNVSGNWSQWRVTLPLPPTSPGQSHTLTIRATDVFGTVGEVSRQFEVQPQPPIVIQPGTKTTLSGAPTTSSITTWTRLEPRSNDADMAVSTSARLFDPLWLLSRQWQLGEFQAEDAGTPIRARVRATAAAITRHHAGDVPSPAGTTTQVTAAPYDPAATPLEVLVERRSMRAAGADDDRMLVFAVEAGLHFLRMLQRQAPSRSYRDVMLDQLALRAIPAPDDALADDGTARYLQSMAGRALDGRRLAEILRTTGAAQWVLDPALGVTTADQPKVGQAATDWLAWYDAMCSEPDGDASDAWKPERLEYAVSIGARFSPVAPDAEDDMTYSAREINGPLDWSAFDLNPRVSLTTPGDQRETSLVEATVPAPVTFPGAPAPRFWEMEDARVAYGLIAVGPTDLAHLMAIEYASSYGNDWFAVPLTVPVGSVVRIDSLVVSDTFGVRNLVRPLGDPALPPPFFSLWQTAHDPVPAGSPEPRIVRNRFLLPPTLGRTLDGATVEEVVFMRDEVANLAWAVERLVESPIESAVPRYETSAAAVTDPPRISELPRYLLASTVPPNWIPLLPVQVPNPSQPPNTPGQVLTRLKPAAVLAPDSTKAVHKPVGELLSSLSGRLMPDEEVPREGVLITRRRRLARWIDGSTWLWTGYLGRIGHGEGSSGLQFDQVLEPQRQR
jgi:hypothetical protein